MFFYGLLFFPDLGLLKEDIVGWIDFFFSVPKNFQQQQTWFSCNIHNSAEHLALNLRSGDINSLISLVGFFLTRHVNLLEKNRDRRLSLHCVSEGQPVC